MRTIFFLGLFLIIIISCGQRQSINSVETKDSLSNITNNSEKFQIWQLDYYPDSIFIARSINDKSWNSSAYAYNIQFSKDSCQFIGWHESLWMKLIQVDKYDFKTTYPTQFFELKFKSDNKLLMREIYIREEKTDTSEYYSYHRTNNILTQDSLKNEIAERIFAGTYKVLFNDTLECEPIVTLDNKFGVKGINGVKAYFIETEIDWDYPVFNAFGFSKSKLDFNKGLSFLFSGDTLIIKDYKEILNENGDFCRTEINRPRLKLLRIK